MSKRCIFYVGVAIILATCVSSQAAVAKVLTPGEQYGGDYKLLTIDKDELAVFFSTTDSYLLQSWYGSWDDPEIVFPNNNTEKPLRYADGEYTFITDGTTTKVYAIAPTKYGFEIPYEVDLVVSVFNTDWHESSYVLIDHYCASTITGRCEEVTKVSYLTITSRPSNNWDPVADLSDQVTTTLALGVNARGAEAAQYYNDNDTLLAFSDYNHDGDDQRMYFFTSTDGALYEWKYEKSGEKVQKIDNLKRVLGNKPFSVLAYEKIYQQQKYNYYMLVKVGSEQTLVGVPYSDTPSRHHAFKVVHTFTDTPLHAVLDRSHFYWSVNVAAQRVKILAARLNDDYEVLTTSFAGRFDQPVQFVDLDDTYDDDHSALLYDTVEQQLRLYRWTGEDSTTEATWLELDHTAFTCSYPCSVQATMTDAESSAMIMTWIDDQGQLWGRIWKDTWKNKLQLSPDGTVVTELPEVSLVNSNVDAVLVWTDTVGAVASTMWHHQDGWELAGQDTAILDQADEYIYMVSTTYYYDPVHTHKQLNHYVVGESNGTISAYYVSSDGKELRATYTDSELISGKKINRVDLYLVAFQNALGELQLEAISNKYTDEF